MTDAQVALAGIDRDGILPGLSAIFADPDMCFLGGRIFRARVEAVRRVQLALVPSHGDAEQPIAAVHLRLMRFDDAEPDTFQHGDVRAVGQRAILPQHVRFRRLRNFMGRCFPIGNRLDLLRAEHAAVQTHVIHRALPHLPQAAPIVDSADGQRCGGVRDRWSQLGLALELPVDVQTPVAGFHGDRHVIPAARLRHAIRAQRAPAAMLQIEPEVVVACPPSGPTGAGWPSRRSWPRSSAGRDSVRTHSPRP